MIDERQKLIRLRREWWLVAAGWLTTAVFGWWGLQQLEQWPYANRWLLLAAIPLAYGLGICWRGLSTNHRAGETDLLPTLGAGNHLTLLRGLGIALLAGFLFSPWPEALLAWLPMLLYTLVSAADFLDGYLARRANHSTVLGATLDGEFDAWGTLLVVLLAIWYGQLPLWYLLIGLTKYLYVLALWWRQRQGRPLSPLPPSFHRRIFAGFQMGFLTVVLWPIVPAAGATIAGTLFALATAVGYGRDWLVVSQKVDINSSVYQKWQRRLYRLTAVWLPPLLRVVLAGCLLQLAGTMLVDAPLVAVFGGWGWDAPTLWANFFWGVLGVGGTTVVAGIFPRLMALLLLFPVGFQVIGAGLTAVNGVTVALLILLLLLGAGRWALWPAEEPFMVKRLGE